MRLFVGFLAPDELKDRLAAELHRVPHAPQGVREIAHDLWHLTVTFLGEVEKDHVPEISAHIKQWTEKTTKITPVLTRFETFPQKKPRYLSGHFEITEIETFRARVDRLRDVLSIYAPEIDRKPWKGHMSLAKVLQRARLQRWEYELEPVEWRPHVLSLVVSRPGQNGSIYTPLETFPWIS